MRLDGQKELTPVVYGDSAVKIHDSVFRSGAQLCFTTHWHERMEILVILNGGLEIYSGDIKEYAKAGSVAVFMPGQPHRGISGPDGVSYRTIMFDVQAFYNSTNATAKYLVPVAEQRIAFAGVSSNPEVFAAAKAVADEQLSGDGASPLLVVGGIYRLLGLLYKYCAAGERIHALSDDRFRNVTEYIERNFREDISSKELSRRFGYDEAYFCRRFKVVTGLTPMMYIQILRLEFAKKTLRTEKNIKISELSALCGFSDPGYFARCFKRHYGMSPSEYVLKHTGQSVG